MPLPLIPAKDIEQKKPIKPVKPIPSPPMRKIGEITLIEEEDVIPAKLGREPSGAKPIIPTGDTCCVGVCSHINSEIDTLGQAIKIRQEELKFLGIGSARMKTRKQVAVLATKISTLKDLRFVLLDKNICKCIELPKK